jgi:response regulator RpfG family c-di-GMP phosphodiesterase
MTGIELRQKINSNDTLKKKCIPFIFLTTNPDLSVISKAYELLIQGYFVKPTKLDDLKCMLARIIDYWKICKFPQA